MPTATPVKKQVGNDTVIVFEIPHWGGYAICSLLTLLIGLTISMINGGVF